MNGYVDDSYTVKIENDKIISDQTSCEKVNDWKMELHLESKLKFGIDTILSTEYRRSNYISSRST